MESWYDYKMETGTMFGGWGAPMDIGKAQDSFDENGKLRYFNYNAYGHLVREYKKPKKEKETIKCYKYNKVGHLAKNYRSKQKMKIRRNQDKSNKEEDKKKGFVESLE